MIVEPSLLDHPNYLRLERRTGDKALYYILRIWGHCQESQRGPLWKDVDDEYVEIVCRWSGSAGDLYKALEDCKFLVRQGADVIVRNWENYNLKLVTNWSNGQNGGRPKKDIAGPPNKKPNRNPTETQPGIGVSDEIREDKRRERETRSNAVASEKGEESAAHIPSADEVVEEGSLRCIPADFCAEFAQAKDVGRYWLNTRGQLIDWRRDLRDQWVKKRAKWKPSPATQKTVEELDAELAQIPVTDEKRRQAKITELLDAKERRRS